MIRESDLQAVLNRDPAIKNRSDAIWFHPGLHAVTLYRLSLELWGKGKVKRSRFLNYVAHVLTGADIHPGAQIGEDFFIDHATGVVIGETSIIGDHVSIFQGVTLGGVSSDRGKRHPTIEDHVVIGADATILGNIRIGRNTRVGAGSVVLKDVPPESTVVGIPGKVIKMGGVRTDRDLCHDDLPDPLKDALCNMEEEISRLRERVVQLEGRVSGKDEI